MKALTIICFCLLALGLRAQPAKHVILVSIDGFRPEMYTAPGWPAPNLQWLAAHGTAAGHLKSVFPAYTYPSHTAMVTGALPARSGIYFNQPRGSKGEWNWFADSIRVPTLWKVLKARGLATAAVEWPLSVSKDITYTVPEIWAVGKEDDRITEARKYATPGLIEEIERNATGLLDSTNLSDNCFCLDENAGRMAAYIFGRYKPAFLAVHLAEVDGMSHGYGKNHDSVRLALEVADHAIGDILQAIENSGLKDSTAVIVVGDHGFCDIHTAFRPNMLIRSLPVRFTASGGSCFLYRRGAGLSDESLVKAVTDSLKLLPKDKRKLFRVIERRELDAIGADSSALMALAAVPGVVFSGGIAKASVVNNGPGTLIQQNPLEGVFFPVSGGHHGYDPNIPDMWTGFIAYGAGIVKHGHLEKLAEPDIAVLVARLLGVEFETPDGKMPEGILSK